MAQAIEIVPETVEEEIAQNVRVICGTRRGSQALDRELGIASDLQDVPGSRGQALLSAEIMDRLPEQEPRVRVMGVTFAGAAEDGEYGPQVSYEVAG